MRMPGRGVREIAPGRHRFNRGQLYLTQLPGGGHYPFGLRERKAETLHRLGDFDGLERLCREDLERGRGDDRVAGFCLMKLGTLAAQRGDGEAGRERLDRALELLERIGEEKNAFICRTALVSISLMQRRFEEAEKAAEELAAGGYQAGNRSALATVLNLQGLAAMELGQSEKALEIFGRMLDLARRHGMTKDQATALGNIARANHDLGRYAEAEEGVRQCLAVCCQLRDPYIEYYALYILAEAYEAQGKLAEAERCYLDDLALARQLGDGPGEQGLLEDIDRIDKAMAGRQDDRARH